MRRFAAPFLLGLLPVMQGCLVHTHKVQQAVAPPPSSLKEATAEQLVAIVNKTCDQLQTLKATVTFQVSVGGERKGKVTDFTSLSGYIRLRAPQALRVVGLLPVVHTQAFDLASNGSTFELLVPHNNKAYTGSNAMQQPSANPIENLRPSIFYNTMVPQAIGANDLVELVELAPTRLDPVSKQLVSKPEYALDVGRLKPNSQVLVRDRRIHFDRQTLLPSGVDIYENGAPSTTAVYGPYASYGDQRYPSTITIRRPREEYQIVIAIQKLTVGEQITDNQFELAIPPSYTVIKLH